MTKLIKIGNTVFNLANVVEVDLEKELDGGGTGVGIYCLNGPTKFKGEEAQALRHYFTNQAADLDQEYKNYLADQELKRFKTDWRQRLSRFCEAKSLYEKDQNAAYFYERFLLGEEDTPVPGVKEPGEESFAEWQAYISKLVEDKVNFLGIPDKDREAFKAYCIASLITQPSWNGYKFWKDEQCSNAVGF